MNQVRENSKCFDCAVGAIPHPSLAKCVPAVDCTVCRCFFSTESGLARDNAVLRVKCGQQIDLADLRNALPVATAELDLRLASIDPRRDLIPTSVRAWQEGYLSRNVDARDPGFVLERPEQLRVFLPAVDGTAASEENRPLAASDGDSLQAMLLSAASASRLPQQCGALNDSVIEDGSLQLSTASNIDEACKAGHYATLTGACLKCSAGQFYQSETGKIGINSECGCKVCGAGTFTPTSGATSLGACQKCPEGTKGSDLAGYRACWCMDGYARTDRFGACKLCATTPGLNCTKDVRSLARGFWWGFATPADRQTYYDLSINLAFERGHDAVATTNITYADSRTTLYPGALPLPQ
eukprot:UC1_evm1s406